MNVEVGFPEGTMNICMTCHDSLFQKKFGIFENGPNKQIITSSIEPHDLNKKKNKYTSAPYIINTNSFIH